MTDEDFLSIQAISHESKPGEDGEIPVLHFKRGKQESERAYVRRMENETKHIHFLTKNQVDRQPELDDDNQDKSTDKGKSEKKKEWVHSFFSFIIKCSPWHWMSVVIIPGCYMSDA